MRPFILDAVSGVVAHLVEHLVRNQKVVGSSPIYSTKKRGVPMYGTPFSSHLDIAFLSPQAE